MSSIVNHRRRDYGVTLRSVVLDRKLLQMCVAEFVRAEIPRCMADPAIVRRVKDWLNVAPRHQVSDREIFLWLHYVYEAAVGLEANFDYSITYSIHPGETAMYVRTEWGGWAHDNWMGASRLSGWEMVAAEAAEIDWATSDEILEMPIMTPAIFLTLESQCV